MIIACQLSNRSDTLRGAELRDQNPRRETRGAGREAASRHRVFVDSLRMCRLL